MGNDLILLRCVEMNKGLVMVEFKDLETHLNRIKDLTGTRVRISKTTSSRRRSLEELEMGFFLG